MFNGIDKVSTISFRILLLLFAYSSINQGINESVVNRLKRG
jgi:hypothetical protein